MKKQVLIVDDEPNIVISLEFLVEQAGYDVAIALGGYDALEKIERYTPDLMLLDIMLPDIDGFEVCRRVRRSSDLASLKIIMLTAKGREVEIAKGLALGANAYITKPFSTKYLLEEIERQLADSIPENI
ncbi:MAG: response regulator [Caldilineaceae bacterium]|nr:response regulator [Caldilineaceae bacterium]MCB9138994.1 response regulator [Caldilineaceae bacterium]